MKITKPNIQSTLSRSSTTMFGPPLLIQTHDNKIMQPCLDSVPDEKDSTLNLSAALILIRLKLENINTLLALQGQK